MTSPLVRRVVTMAEARAAYEAAYQARDVAPSPHTELVLELARERFAIAIALREARD